MYSKAPKDSLRAGDVVPLESTVTSPGMVFQSANGTICACNASVLSILGYSIEQLQGRNYADLNWQTIRADGSPFKNENYPGQVALETGKACQNVVLGFYKPDGELVWLSLSSQPLFVNDVATPYGVVTTFTQLDVPGIKGAGMLDRCVVEEKNEVQTELELIQQQLQHEISQCQEVESRLVAANNQLEQQVAARTAELSQALAGLAESAALYRTLAKNFPNGAVVLFDFNLRYLLVEGEELLSIGLSHQEMIGKTIWEVLPEETCAILEPTYRKALAGETTVTEIPYKNYIYSRYALPVKNEQGEIFAGMVMTQNITERKQSETALRRSELNFRTLADTMPQIIWTAQPDGWLDYYNQRWYDYTGMDWEQTQGWGWQPVLHPDDLQMCLDTWSESVRTGKDYQIEYRFRRASDGEYRWHLGRAFPLKDENGQIVKWFGSSTDIDDNKRTEVTLQDALQQQKIARAEAEKANRIKDEFLAVLSHELRSPLNPILGWSKLLLAGKLNPKQTQQAIETIERNAKLQIDLIDDLLDVSRILRGKLTLNISSVNLNSIITAASETVHFTAQAKKIELIATLEANIEKAKGDPARLQQVVLNLLTNAIKFTPNGGRIEVKLLRVGTEAQIIVTDNGKGISPEFLKSIFDYFRQEDSSITRKFGGLGLGLAIVRQIVELHGGTVKAESPGLEQGATFTVTLPLMVPEPEIVCSDSRELPSEFLNLSGIRVLVVDDENDSRDFVGFTLQQYGASVTAVSSASEALQVIAQLKPDVLVSDIGMPEMDGYALIREIRSWTHAEAGRIPAIAVTAYAGEYDQRQAIDAGFQVHVPKPVESEVLAAAVRRLGRGG